MRVPARARAGWSSTSRSTRPMKNACRWSLTVRSRWALVADPGARPRDEPLAVEVEQLERDRRPAGDCVGFGEQLEHALGRSRHPCLRGPGLHRCSSIRRFKLMPTRSQERTSRRLARQPSPAGCGRGPRTRRRGPDVRRACHRNRRPLAHLRKPAAGRSVASGVVLPESVIEDLELERAVGPAHDDS